MALSFATEAGCNEVWDIIERVRNYLIAHASAHSAGYNSDPPSSPSPSTSSPIVGGPHPMGGGGSLPEPSLATLKDIDNFIKWAGRTALGREKLAGVIVKSVGLERVKCESTGC